MADALRPYSGPLSSTQALAGINACQANAVRLIEDAETLVEAGAFASGAALAVLAIEERGKVNLLRRIVLLPEGDELRSAWRSFRDHKSKSGGWTVSRLVGEGGRSLVDFADALNPKSGHAARLNLIKQVNLYADCVGASPDWLVPENDEAEELALGLIEVAKNTWGVRSVTQRDMDLWVEYVAPHFGLPTMREAVLAYQGAMNREGLYSVTESDMRAFVYGEAAWPPTR